MNIVVVNLSTFTSTEYENAKSISFDYTEQRYVITKNDNTVVRYNANAVIIGFRP